MKILFLIDNLGSGGAQRQMTTIACLLKSNNFDVNFLIYSDSLFFSDILINNGISIKRIYSSSVVLRLFKIRSYIRKGNFDVVISFMDTPNFINCFSALGKHKWKVITSERSSKEETFKNIKNKFFNFFQRYADVIVCNSNKAKRMWEFYYPNLTSKLCTIYNAVDIDIQNVNENISDSDNVSILIAASYREIKNPINLIKAVSLLSDEEKNRLNINWYGERFVKDIDQDNNTYHNCVRLLNEMNLNNIVHLHSATDNIYELMSNSDFIGLFSYIEGLPNSICEGMALAKPIVMTKVSDYKKFVDISNGVICSDFTSTGISKALRSVLDLSSEEKLQMGFESFRKSQKLFNSKIIIDNWIKIIKS